MVIQAEILELSSAIHQEEDLEAIYELTFPDQGPPRGRVFFAPPQTEVCLWPLERWSDQILLRTNWKTSRVSQSAVLPKEP